MLGSVCLAASIAPVGGIAEPSPPGTEVTLVSSDFFVDGGRGIQAWGDGVTLQAFDWYGNPSRLGYDTDFTDSGIGVFAGRFRQIDFDQGRGDISERIEIDFGGEVSNVEVTFGQMSPNEGSSFETGIWTAFDDTGAVVAGGLLSPELSSLGPFVEVPGSLKAYPIELSSVTPFSKVAIEATGFGHGAGNGVMITNDAAIWHATSYLPVPFEQNTDFNIMSVRYTRESIRVNASPIAFDNHFWVSIDGQISGSVVSNDFEPDGDTLQVILLADAGRGTLDLASDGSFTYVPDAGYMGFDAFTYQVHDGRGGFDNGTVEFTIESPQPSLAGRVRTGLQALYTFESSGSVVRDVSRVGAPLDLVIPEAAPVTWIDGTLRLDGSTLIKSVEPASKIIDAIRQSNEITVEAWIDPADIGQTGPARIVTISRDESTRNVTLSESSDGVGAMDEARLKTTATNNNGTPALTAHLLSDGLVHVTYTRTADGVAAIYHNRVLVAYGAVDGDLSTWVSDYELALGNELTGDRPWRGSYELVAIFDRALDATEVAQNFAAGPNGYGPAPPMPVPALSAIGRLLLVGLCASIFVRRRT